jgi:hypothetical protein
MRASHYLAFRCWKWMHAPAPAPAPAPKRVIHIIMLPFHYRTSIPAQRYTTSQKRGTTHLRVNT